MQEQQQHMCLLLTGTQDPSVIGHVGRVNVSLDTMRGERRVVPGSSVFLLLTNTNGGDHLKEWWFKVISGYHRAHTLTYLCVNKCALVNVCQAANPIFLSLL